MRIIYHILFNYKDILYSKKLDKHLTPEYLFKYLNLMIDNQVFL
jgi:hypothetical protein